MNQSKLYVIKWQKSNIDRVRMHKLRWYYKNRKVINMLFSKPTGIMQDDADRWLETHE